jgi:hypothetical protein
MENTLKKMEGNTKTLNLLDIIQNKKVCLRCINNSCTINKPHGFVLPEKERKKMSIFVVNPTYIKKFGKLIEISHLDFNGKKPFYTICNFIDKKCKNCSEGRIKYVNYENKQVILCYPFLDNIKDKVTVGVHIDIKLILKGDEKYDVSFIPLDAENHLQNHTFTNILFQKLPTSPKSSPHPKHQEPMVHWVRVTAIGTRR